MKQCTVAIALCAVLVFSGCLLLPLDSQGDEPDPIVPIEPLPPNPVVGVWSGNVTSEFAFSIVFNANGSFSRMRRSLATGLVETIVRGTYTPSSDTRGELCISETLVHGMFARPECTPYRIRMLSNSWEFFARLRRNVALDSGEIRQVFLVFDNSRAINN